MIERLEHAETQFVDRDARLRTQIDASVVLRQELDRVLALSADSIQAVLDLRAALQREVTIAPSFALSLSPSLEQIDASVVLRHELDRVLALSADSIQALLDLRAALQREVFVAPSSVLLSCSLSLEQIDASVVLRQDLD